VESALAWASVAPGDERLKAKPYGRPAAGLDPLVPPALLGG